MHLRSYGSEERFFVFVAYVCMWAALYLTVLEVHVTVWFRFYKPAYMCRVSKCSHLYCMYCRKSICVCAIKRCCNCNAKAQIPSNNEPWEKGQRRRSKPKPASRVCACWREKDRPRGVYLNWSFGETRGDRVNKQIWGRKQERRGVGWCFRGKDG